MGVYVCNKDDDYFYDNFYLDKQQLYEEKSFLYKFFHKIKENHKILFNVSILIMAFELHALVSRERTLYYEYEHRNNLDRKDPKTIVNNDVQRISPKYTYEKTYYKFNPNDYLIIKSTRKILYLLEPIFIIKSLNKNEVINSQALYAESNKNLLNLDYSELNPIQMYKVQKQLNFPDKLVIVFEEKKMTKQINLQSNENGSSSL